MTTGQLETVRSKASLRSSKLAEVRRLLLLSDISVDLSTMSTSMPSSSGAEETGEGGTGRMLEAEGRQVEAVSLMLRSMGESPL